VHLNLTTFPLLRQRIGHRGCPMHPALITSSSTRRACAHVATVGDGEPVVLLHGFPQHWWQWHQIAPRIAEHGYRVICPDPRGAGWTEADDSGIERETRLHDLLAILEALGIECAHRPSSASSAPWARRSGIPPLTPWSAGPPPSSPAKPPSATPASHPHSNPVPLQADCAPMLYASDLPIGLCRVRHRSCQNAPWRGAASMVESSVAVSQPEPRATRLGRRATASSSIPRSP
jgi:alpha/beta hydrolase fold